MKRISHHNEVVIIGAAILGFILVGLSVSFTIRACNHHNYHTIDYEGYSLNRIELPSRQSIPEEAATEETVSGEPESDFIPDICFTQSPQGLPEQILLKKTYIVSYNKDTKLPNWVAWHLTGNHADGPIKRPNIFYEDDNVPMPRATAEDYRGSGWSRGHMCPAGDNKWDATAMNETFSLVNICPQNANLNSGIWNSIEIDCRRWAKKYGELFIVCGPILMNKKHETIGANEVVVPEAFFKVILCLNDKPKAFGFIVRNADGNKKNDVYYNSVDEVERITGFDFFCSLPDEIENEVEATADLTLWN